MSNELRLKPDELEQASLRITMHSSRRPNKERRARLFDVGVVRDHAKITSVGDGELTRWRISEASRVDLWKSYRTVS